MAQLGLRNKTRIILLRQLYTEPEAGACARFTSACIASALVSIYTNAVVIVMQDGGLA